MIIRPQGNNAEPEAPRPNGYDLNYILRSFNLLPVPVGAFNAGSITWIEIRESGHAVFHLHGGDLINLTAPEMAELEKTIHAREIEAQRIRAEAIARDVRAQTRAQVDAATEVVANASMAHQLKRGS